MAQLVRAGAASLAAALLLAACTTTHASILPARSSAPVTLSRAEMDVVARDTRPAVANASSEAKDIDAAGAVFRGLKAARADGRVYVCGWVDAHNTHRDVTRTFAFEGELVQSVMFVREYIGGNEDQNAFVLDACRKRGIDLR